MRKDARIDPEILEIMKRRLRERDESIVNRFLAGENIRDLAFASSISQRQVEQIIRESVSIKLVIMRDEPWGG